ncbi:hypothetical protein C0033_14530 [Clostridium sp. chh4-2]|uniref:hypothetical protein n=1 Tax=Clostridium sp. chh4-2 TaxID=2067550 RepID=UPI000CCDDBD6|nr:hypothetical protein [Clostridium sp. chh4-2]PNV61211.1 hypothetical protein C0033_14530 [Clostridium sp. chh4-2]
MKRHAFLITLFITGLLMFRMSASAAGPESGKTFSLRQKAFSFSHLMEFSARKAEAEDTLVLDVKAINSKENTATGSNGTEVEILPELMEDSDEEELDMELETATASNAEEPVPESAVLNAAQQRAFQQEAETVSTAEELSDWLHRLDGSGGEVELGATITIEESIFAYENQSGTVRINTGRFGLIYDGGFIDVLGLELIGEGVDVPVLEIKSMDIYYGWMPAPDWNLCVSGLDVTAVGRNGLGGVAVQIDADSKTRTSTAGYDKRGSIHSYGDGAVGVLIKTDNALKTYFLDIDVEGENAHAVSALNGANLFGCKLTAQGEGASVIAGSQIILDTCALSPEPREGVVIRQSLDQRLGIEPQIKQNDGPDDIDYLVCLDETQRYRLTGGGYLDLYLDHDENYADNIDTKVLGKVDIPVSLPEYLQGLGLENETDLTFRVWVRDPALPILRDVNQNENTLSFFSWEDAVVVPGLVLWCSEDDGATWSDITDWEAVEWNKYTYRGNLFDIDANQIKGPMLLALENRAGWGNVVSFTPGEDGRVSVGTGGDRDGGDREEQEGGDGGQHDGGKPGDNPGEDHTEGPSGGGSSGEGPSGGGSSGEGPSGGGSSGEGSSGGGSSEEGPSGGGSSEEGPSGGGSSGEGPSGGGSPEEGSSDGSSSEEWSPGGGSPEKEPSSGDSSHNGLSDKGTSYNGLSDKGSSNGVPSEYSSSAYDFPPTEKLFQPVRPNLKPDFDAVTENPSMNQDKTGQPSPYQPDLQQQLQKAPSAGAINSDLAPGSSDKGSHSPASDNPGSEPDAEKLQETTVLPSEPQPSNNQGLALSVFVLCAAGVITALAAFRRKSGDR